MRQGLWGTQSGGSKSNSSSAGIYEAHIYLIFGLCRNDVSAGAGSLGGKLLIWRKGLADTS